MSKYTHEDGTPFTKEEFLEKLETDTEFNNEFGNRGVDQISELVKQLKENPDSRRLMVNAWAVDGLPKMVLPPCHYGFQVYTRELSEKERIILAGYDYENRGGIGWNMIKETVDMDNTIPRRAISLMWNQRSVDTFLGLPFNIASYGLLLEILAKEVNMVPDELIGNLGDTHLYLNHVEQAKEQIGRDLTDEERYNKWFNLNYETGMERSFDPNNLPDFDNEYYEPTPKRTRDPYPLPKLNINTEHWNASFLEMISSEAFCKCLLEEDLQLYNYQSHPSIKAPLSN
jgi:thymidylate synthase